MALSTSAIPAEETAAIASGRPLVIASNALDAPTRPPVWRDASVSLSFVSFDDPGAPAWLVATRNAARRSRALYRDTLWHLAFEVSGAWDTFVMPSHNLEGVTLRLERSDAIDFAGAATVLADTVVGAGRFVAYLGTRYSGTGYVRVRLTAGADFRPEVGGLWLGRRRPLRRGPNAHDPVSRSAYFDASGPADGFELVLRRRNGGRVLEQQYQPDDTLAALRDSDTWRAIWTESRHGTAPVLYARAPSTTPADIAIVRLTSTIAVRELGGELREVTLAGYELPPYLAAEGL